MLSEPFSLQGGRNTPTPQIGLRMGHQDFLFNLVKVFEGSPSHRSSAWFYRNRTFPSPEVAPGKTTPHVTSGDGNLSEGWQSTSMRLSTSGSRTQSQNLPKSAFSVQTEDTFVSRVSSSSSRRSTTPEGRTGRKRRLSQLPTPEIPTRGQF